MNAQLIDGPCEGHIEQVSDPPPDLKLVFFYPEPAEEYPLLGPGLKIPILQWEEHEYRLARVARGLRGWTEPWAEYAHVSPMGRRSEGR